MQSAATVLGVLRNHRRAGYPETGPSGSEGGRAEKDQFTLAPRRPADPTQTLKNWLAAQSPQPATLAQLQQLLGAFTTTYNHHRPHRSLPGQATPAIAYTARPKASPGDRANDTHNRVRTYRLDANGTVTLRHGGKVYHIGIGRGTGVPRIFRTADPYRIFTRKDGITWQGNTGNSLLSSVRKRPGWSWRRHGRSRMLPASSGSMRPRLVTGCGITARSTRMMSLHCSCPSGRGCGSWNVRTASCG